MKKNKKLFVIWGILVVALIILLTVIGILLKMQKKDYKTLEDKLRDSAIKYVDNQFLYPDEGDLLRITSDILIEHEFLDELKVNDDICVGYVEIYKEGVYQYKAYLKCNDYKTNGYQEK